VTSKDEDTAAEQEGGRSPAFIKGILKQDEPGGESPRKEGKRSGLAQVPSTVLTVEYVDGSDGMDASLRALDGRITKLGNLAGHLQQTSAELVAVIHQQTAEIGQFIESINNRLDQVYRELSANSGERDDLAALSGADDEIQKEFGIPEQFAEDPAHEKAWRTACVLVADLEAYYGDKVRESVLYDNLPELLKEPLAKARQTYEERVPAKVRGEFDYFQLAIDELLLRKKLEIAQEDGAPE
jgi:hypothetical protein